MKNFLKTAIRGVVIVPALAFISAAVLLLLLVAGLVMLDDLIQKF